MDLKARNKMTSNSVAVGGNYGLTQACLFVAGIPQNIHKLDFTSELMMTYQSPENVPAKDQWDESLDCYTITTKEIGDVIAENVEEKYQELLEECEMDSDFENNPKQEHKLRLKAAKHLKTGILGKLNSDSFTLMSDIKHPMWSWVKFIFSILVSIMYNSWGWHYNEIKECVLCFKMKILEAQVDEWYSRNKSGDPNNVLIIHLPGECINKMVYRFTAFLSCAAIVAHENKNEFESVVLAIMWVIWKQMRIVWDVLHTPQFDKQSRFDTPQPIHDMIDAAKLAFYLCEMLCDWMVCLNNMNLCI